MWYRQPMPGEPVQNCAGCGAGLTLDHLRGTDCPYCKMVFPHHARAVEQLAQAGVAQPPGGFGAAAPGSPYGAPGAFPSAPLYGAPPVPHVPDRAMNRVGIVILVMVVFALVGVVLAMAAGFLAFFAVR